MDADSKITLAIDLTIRKVASPSLQKEAFTDWQKINFGAFFPAETWTTTTTRDLQVYSVNILEINKLSEEFIKEAYEAGKTMRTKDPQDLDDLEAVLPGQTEADFPDQPEPPVIEEDPMPEYVETIYTDEPVEVLVQAGRFMVCVEKSATGGYRLIAIPDDDISRRYPTGEYNPDQN